MLCAGCAWTTGGRPGVLGAGEAETEAVSSALQAGPCGEQGERKTLSVW